MMEEAIRIVSEYTGVSVDDIMSVKRERNISEARQIFIFLSCGVYGKTQTSIAHFLNRSPQGISEQLKVFVKHLEAYKGLDKRVKEIKDAIV